MDPLKLEVLNSLAGVRTGDSKVDGVIMNVKSYMVNFLRQWDDGNAKIDAKKNRYTEDGLNHERKKLGEKIRFELDELVVQENYREEIQELREKLSVPKNESEIQAITRVMLEIETRNLMIQAAGDPLKFETTFGQAILEGNPIIISAIENSILPLPVMPEVFEQGRQARDRRLNPQVSNRLRAIETAQQAIDSLTGEVNQVLGNPNEMEISGA
jgi:hypothetical protein